MQFGTIVCCLVLNQCCEFGNKIPSQCRDISDRLTVWGILARPVYVCQISALHCFFFQDLPYVYANVPVVSIVFVFYTHESEKSKVQKL
jgi:hypothetical protein